MSGNVPDNATGGEISEEFVQACKELLQDIQTLIMALDAHHRNVNIARITGSSVSIVGGILAIVGGALTLTGVLAPVGVPLAFAGMGVGAAGASTNIGSRVTKYFLTKKNLANLQAKFDSLRNTLNQKRKTAPNLKMIDSTEGPVDDVATENTGANSGRAAPPNQERNTGPNVKMSDSTEGLVDDVPTENTGANSGRAAPPNQERNTGPNLKMSEFTEGLVDGVAIGSTGVNIGRTVLTVIDTAGDIGQAVSAARVGKTAAGVAVRAAGTFGKVSIIGSAILMPLDIAEIALVSRNMYKGEGHPACQNLKKFAGDLEEFCRNVDDGDLKNKRLAFLNP